MLKNQYIFQVISLAYDNIDVIHHFKDYSTKVTASNFIEQLHLDCTAQENIFGGIKENQFVRKVLEIKTCGQNPRQWLWFQQKWQQNHLDEKTLLNIINQANSWNFE